MPNTRRIADLAYHVKASDIRAYDVRGLTLVADALIICGASSQPQFRAILNTIKVGMKDIGIAPLHAEGESTGGWLVLDYGAIIVHIFRTEAREFYDLDGLWADAPRIDLELDVPQPR